MNANLENLAIPEKLKFIVDSYQQSYGKFPNCIIAPDQTIKYFLNNNYLRNYGKEKKEYSGTRLETKTSTTIKVYWLGRFKSEELSYLVKDKKNKKLKLYKTGGIIPLIFATETSSWIKRSIDRVNRFSNPLFCDLGTPLEQLKQRIILQLSKKNNKTQ